MSAPIAIVEARGVSKVYPMPAGPVEALRDVSLTVAPGEYVAISGPSGCGKSTLLHLLGCVDTPTAGSLLFEGRPVLAMGERERSRIRLRRIGFVFQRFYLLPMLTAWENVELVQSEAGMPAAERRARTRALLDYVGLGERAGHRPSQLSGGEMQRVAIARALANRPGLVLRGDVPSPMNPPSGCRFRTRCPLAEARCADAAPALRDTGGGHLVACHFADAAERLAPPALRISATLAKAEALAC